MWFYDDVVCYMMYLVYLFDFFEDLELIKENLRLCVKVFNVFICILFFFLVKWIF